MHRTRARSGAASAIWARRIKFNCRPIRGQVVGFRNGRVLSMPLEEAVGLQLGDRVIAREEAAFIGVGRDLLGRVLDGFGHPIDSGVRLTPEANYSIFATPPNPLDR